jgi:uncharacterized protein YllA (UPF0747 family)
VTVAGPSEVAYFAQVNAISPFWGLKTCSHPRSGFTVVDRKSQRYLGRYGLRAEDVLSCTLPALTERILRKKAAGEVLSHIDSTQGRLERDLDVLTESLLTIDPTVAEMLGRSRKKMRFQMNKVRNRFVSNQREHDAHLKRQINHLRSYLMPESVLQERVVNFNQFLASEGRQLLDRLIEMVDPFDHFHNLVFL